MKFMQEITNVRIAKVEDGYELGENMSIGKVRLQNFFSIEQVKHQSEKAILVELTHVGPTNSNTGDQPRHTVQIWFPKSKVFLCQGRVLVYEHFLQAKLFKSANLAFRNDY